MRISDSVYLAGSEQFGLSHPLDCNCYLVDGGSELALVDAGLGLGVDDICSNVTRMGFSLERLRHVFITHSHNGHWGGADALRSRTGAMIWAHEDAAPLMADISRDPGIQTNLRFGRYPPGYTPRACVVDSVFRDGDRLRVGNLELQVIHTKGHTADSCCLLVDSANQRSIFTADTVFYGGKLGILNLEGCVLADYRKDIHKLAGLGVDQLFPGHGVFVLRRGQRHLDRAIHKLSDFVLPESFFEMNELMWDKEYLKLMSA